MTTWIEGTCPACGYDKVLFVETDDAGTYVTCSLIGCPDPILADFQAEVLGVGPAVGVLDES